MNTHRIVITGGPSTGKTAVVKVLQQRGYLCLEEVIRAMTTAQKAKNKELVFKSNPIVSVNDPETFNRSILKGRIKQFESTRKTDEKLVFFDRGIPDVLAYMDCFNQAYDKSFEKACRHYRYDLIFLMPPWKAIHIADDERFETFEESLRINECLLNTYAKFGYDVKLVPKDSISNRVDFILNTVKVIK